VRYGNEAEQYSSLLGVLAPLLVTLLRVACDRMVSCTQSFDSMPLPQLPDAIMRAATPATKGDDIEVPARMQEGETLLSSGCGAEHTVAPANYKLQRMCGKLGS
jgi:hypothetical protein